MQTVIYNLGEAVGTAVIYSLGQGLIIYLLLRIVLLAFGQMQSNYRYWLSISALLGIFLCFINTLFTTLYNQDWSLKPFTPAVSPALPLNFDTLRAAPQDIYQYYSISLKLYLPYISILYMLGLLLQLSRLVWSRQQINRLKKSLVPHQQFTVQVQLLAQKMGIRKVVRVGTSPFAAVPCVAGYLKPIIFLPLTLLTQLSAEEIEAILLHELAHIKRNDYLINYMQQVLATLLFFNPFATFINHSINTTRENCCDDIVVSLTSTPLPYAHALLKLQENQQQYSLAMAAKSSNFKLLNRIQRIMKTEKPHNNLRHLVFALVLLTASAFSIAWFNPEFKNGKLTVKVKKQPEAKLIAEKAPNKGPKNSSKKPLIINAIKEMSLFTSKDTSRFQDTLLERLANRLDDLDEQRQAVLDRDEYKGLVFTLGEKNKILTEYYSRPDIQQKIKQIPTDHYQLSDSLDAASNKIWSAYLEDNFREQEKTLLRKHGIYKGYDNYTKHQNWEKYKAEWEQYKMTKLKAESDEMQRIGDQMKKYYDKEEFRKERLTEAQSDSLHSVYDSPAIVQTKKEIKQLKVKIRAIENGEERYALSKQIFQITDSINTRLKSPEFKQRLYTFMKAHPEQVDITKWAH